MCEARGGDVERSEGAAEGEHGCCCVVGVSRCVAPGPCFVFCVCDAGSAPVSPLQRCSDLQRRVLLVENKLYRLCALVLSTAIASATEAPLADSRRD